jgi:hypothetical protein
MDGAEISAGNINLLLCHISDACKRVKQVPDLEIFRKRSLQAQTSGPLDSLAFENDIPMKIWVG